jgi:hypothetical protein
MKIAYIFFILISVFFVSPMVSASIFDDGNSKTHYCDGWSCWLINWVDQVWNEVKGVVTDRWFSQYIQDIVTILITFVSIIAVIYIIYAWFVILTAAWDDEKITKMKKLIIYVVIWIIIIWLAWSIFIWIAWVLDSNWWSGRWLSCDHCYALPFWAERNQCLTTYNCY